MKATQPLTCLMLGLRPLDQHVLATVLRLFRASLSRSWHLTTERDATFDALLCDLDGAGFEAAGVQGEAFGTPRLGLTRAIEAPQDWLVLRLPLRGHGAGGVVSVFNDAAAMLDRTTAPPHPRSVERQLDRIPEIAVQHGSSVFALWVDTVEPASRSAVAVPVMAFADDGTDRYPDPAGDEGSERRSAAPVFAPLPEASSRDLPEPEGAEAPERDTVGEPGPDDTARSAAPPEASAPATLLGGRPRSRAVATVPRNESAETIDEMRSALERVRFHSRGVPFHATSLLTVLRWSLAQSDAVVITLPGLPAICIDPAERTYYSEVVLADLAKLLTATPAPPIRVVPFGQMDEAQDAARSTVSAPRSLDQLLWLACVRCPVPEIDHNARLMHRLRRWPDMGQLPHGPEHLRWCGILVRTPMSLGALAAATQSSLVDASAFLDACFELRLLECHPATPAELALAAAPEQSEQTKLVRRKISLFRSILNKLGVR